MDNIFVALRIRGPGWDDSKPLEGQTDWTGHAAFMDDLFARGIVILVGPLEDTRHALIVMRATSEADVVQRLAPDPWTVSGLLVTTMISRWQVRLGTLPPA